jgi:hypothetical protein
MLEGASPSPARFFGNVRERSVFDIWESADYRDFRRNVVAGRFPEVCVGCSYAVGLLC